jgi:hypothetical protein
MKGNNAVRMWRSFVVAAAVSPGTPDHRERDEERLPIRLGPAATGSPAAWDPYEVWLKRVKEPRDRRSTPR